MGSGFRVWGFFRVWVWVQGLGFGGFLGSGSYILNGFRALEVGDYQGFQVWGCGM